MAVTLKRSALLLHHRFANHHISSWKSSKLRAAIPFGAWCRLGSIYNLSRSGRCMQARDRGSIPHNPFNLNLFLPRIQLSERWVTVMMEQPLASAALAHKKRKSVTRRSSPQNQASKKSPINPADCNVFTSVSLSQECQRVIMPPSITLTAASIGCPCHTRSRGARPGGSGLGRAHWIGATLDHQGPQRLSAVLLVRSVGF